MPWRVPVARADHSRGPSLPPRCSSRGSPVLRSPRTPAAHDSLSPRLIRAALPRPGCADGPLVFRPSPCTRAAPPTPPRPARVHSGLRHAQTWPSPRHDRLGSRVVNLTRLQASLDVAARVLAPSVEAFDTPLGPPGSLTDPGVCYSALRRLPRRDLHPLEKNSGMQTSLGQHRHDAPCRNHSRTATRQRP